MLDYDYDYDGLLPPPKKEAAPSPTPCARDYLTVLFHKRKSLTQIVYNRKVILCINVCTPKCGYAIG